VSLYTFTYFVAPLQNLSLSDSLIVHNEKLRHTAKIFGHWMAVDDNPFRERVGFYLLQQSLAIIL